MDIMPTLGKVDSVVTDPPYGINFTQPTTGKKIIGDDRYFDPTFLVDLSVPSIIWGGNYFADRLPLGGWLFWIKRAVEISAPRSFSDGELAWTNIIPTVKAIRNISDGCIREGAEFGIVREHPFQKPIKVMRWCIGFIKDENQTILDPFMGSGTTGVACVNLSRKFIGIEKEQKYFDIACKRIDEATRQPRLFKDETPAPVQQDLI